MATLKQRKAITKTIENYRNQTIKPMGQVMVESGYSEVTATHPKVLTNSKAFKTFEQAIKDINWAKHIRQLEELADTDKNTDKDNVLKAKDMLIKAGDKWPKDTSKYISMFTKIEAIEDK